MSGTSEGFGEHGAFTVSVTGDSRLVETVHELTRKAAEMSGCAATDAAGLADAATAVASALAEDLDLAYRPMPEALVLEVRPARRGQDGRSLRAVLSRDAFAKVKALVPGAELQGSGADERCLLTCPRTDAPPA
jgi:hypothetical protein